MLSSHNANEEPASQRDASLHLDSSSSSILKHGDESCHWCRGFFESRMKMQMCFITSVFSRERERVNRRGGCPCDKLLTDVSYQQGHLTECLLQGPWIPSLPLFTPPHNEGPCLAGTGLAS